LFICGISHFGNGVPFKTLSISLRDLSRNLSLRFSLVQRQRVSYGINSIKAFLKAITESLEKMIENEAKNSGFLREEAEKLEEIKEKEG